MNKLTIATETERDSILASMDGLPNVAIMSTEYPGFKLVGTIELDQDDARVLWLKLGSNEYVELSFDTITEVEV